MAKKGQKYRKTLARIQTICYNGYARKPFGYNGNREKYDVNMM